MANTNTKYVEIKSSGKDGFKLDARCVFRGRDVVEISGPDEKLVDELLSGVAGPDGVSLTPEDGLMFLYAVSGLYGNAYMFSTKVIDGEPPVDKLVLEPQTKENTVEDIKKILRELEENFTKSMNQLRDLDKERMEILKQALSEIDDDQAAKIRKKLGLD